MEKNLAESLEPAFHDEHENKQSEPTHNHSETTVLRADNNNGLATDNFNGKTEEPQKQIESSSELVTNESSVGDFDKSTSQALVNSPNITENSVNASTRVLLDESIYDRLASLNLTNHGDDKSSSKPEDNDDEALITPEPSTNKDELSACEESFADRSKLLGEISDHSECSVEVDTLEQVEKDETCSKLSDEEMFIEEQEEDVEEEEEFHEVDEEKLRTCQESVSDSCDASSTPGNQKSTKPSERKSSEPLQEKSEVVFVNDTTTIEAREGVENKTVVSNTQELLKTSTVETEENQLPTDSIKDNIHTNETKSDAKTEPKDIPKATDWANIMFSNENPDALTDDTAKKEEDVSDVKENIGEGQKKELDLDEDVKNPQYIPKKGVFYEHDDRSHDDNSKKVCGTPTKKDVEVNEKKEASTSKRVGGTQEKPVDSKRGNRRQRTDADRWNHDLFRDTRQKPKSKSDLITAYGYDIRSERTQRNNQTAEGRQPRAGNSENNGERANNQDNQRSRQVKDNRGSGRQNQTSNRSRERRSRRGPNVRNNFRVQNNILTSASSTPKNDQQIRSSNAEPKYDTTDSKQIFAAPQPSIQPPMQTENSTNQRDQRGSRFESRTRRQNSRDRPVANPTDDNLPPLTTVMPPITTWSNKIEDMVKEEANSRDSPSRHLSTSSTNSRNRTKSNEQWPQNHQQNKSFYTDRGPKNFDENRQQPLYPNRNRYGSREESHKTSQYANRNQFNDRPSQQSQDWHRTTNYNNVYSKSTEYEPIKTQTFENSKLSQLSINRSHYRDQRDAREIINERRMMNHQQHEQSYQPKIQPSISGRELHLQQQQQLQQRQPTQQQHPKHLQNQPQQLHHTQSPQQQQQNSHHLRHQLRNHVTQPQSPQIQGSRDQQHPPTQSIAQQQQQHQQQTPRTSQQQPPSQLQHVTPGRQNLTNNNVLDNIHESSRLNVGATGASNDTMNNNSRPIIKTDSYTNAPQHVSLTQHSHNHLTGSMSQPSGTATTHIVPSHLGTANAQAQYYSPTVNSRDSAAALASAYHGYIPGGHSVLDTSRYHMTSQLSDHGYIAPTDPTTDVPSAASVLHQQGMYAEPRPAGSAVASSGYMAQTAPTLSPSTNIPVTGTGPPPLTPVSYLQHSQYAPPPYTNPYSHPQHNHQPPPQSSHAYPYWTYI